MNIFKKQTSPKDALRTSKREMSVATRGIEREIASLQLEDKKLVAEIKKTGNEIEMMSESIYETLDKAEAEAETEELTNQVLDEIGIDIASQELLVEFGSSESSDVEDLEKRLASLRHS